MSFFKVSFSAANNTLSYLQRIARNGWTVVAPNEIKKQLSNFIHSVNYGKTCLECNSFFVFENSIFCPNCGSANLNNQERGDDFNMKYPGIAVDSNSKAVICPICQNSEILPGGNHCGQCGVYLVNECTNTEYDGYNDVEYKTCEGTLPGIFRHCHKCGAESTF